MISLVIWVAVLVIIAILVWWILSQLPLPPPIRTVLDIVLVVIVVLILIVILLQIPSLVNFRGPLR